MRTTERFERGMLLHVTKEMRFQCSGEVTLSTSELFSICCVHELMTFQSAFRLELFSTEVTKMSFLSTVSVHVSFEVAFTS